MSVGVVFTPHLPPEELASVVRDVEEAGVPELWLWEDCFFEGGLTAATAALAASARVRVCIGLLPVPLRNPALLAMELATVARLWPDRFVPVLGHGVQRWMDQVGATVGSPMTLLREHTVAVRDLLEGRTVDVRGRYVRLDAVALDWPPVHRPPLLLGARGPRTISLAGEVADGVVLDTVTGTERERVSQARALVDEARAGSGRPGRGLVVAYSPLDPSAPAPVLAEQVGERVALLRGAGADTVVVHGTAESPDPRPLVEALTACGLVGSVGP